MSITAENLNGEWVAIDPEGGVWWPSDQAQEEIQGSPDPEQAVIAMAESAPMRGEWKQ